MLSGVVSLIFGVAIVTSVVLIRWIGAEGIAAVAVTAYVGFSSARDPVADLYSHFLSLASNPGCLYVEKNKHKEAGQ